MRNTRPAKIMSQRAFCCKNTLGAKIHSDHKGDVAYKTEEATGQGRAARVHHIATDISVRTLGLICRAGRSTTEQKKGQCTAVLLHPPQLQHHVFLEERFSC